MNKFKLFFFSSILVSILQISIVFGSPITQTTPYEVFDETEETTTEYFDITFRVEEEMSENSSLVGEANKQTPLPSDEVKDPVKDSIVVFRQEEEEDESEEEEEEEEEEKAVTANSTTSVIANPENPENPEQEQPTSLSQGQKESQVVQVEESSSVEPPHKNSVTPKVSVEQFIPENSLNVLPSSSSPPFPLEGDEGPEVPESSVQEEPSSSKPPPRPSIIPVQEGIIPVQEPGGYTRRPKPTPTTTSTSPLPPQLHADTSDPVVDSSNGIPVEENPSLLQAVQLPPTGKYKIIKTKNVTVDSGEQGVNSSSIRPPLSISEEWNLTNSIFTLAPQGRADCECGKIPFKVDNADKSGINEYPWTIAIVRAGIFGGGRPHCGGVLINNVYVLSSASCFDSHYVDGLQVWLTAHNSLQSVDNFIQSDRVIKRDVREILMHPNYDQKVHDNDIALVKLSHPIDISTSSYYVPACLPAGMSLYDGMTARVMGWGGASSGNNRFSSNKMCKEDIPVVSNQVCNRDTSHRNKITSNQLCAGFITKQPTESCIGDIGGPLMLPNNGRFTLIGLVSFGFTNRQAYTPVVYTRVGGYADWILHNTQDADWCSL